MGKKKKKSLPTVSVCTPTFNRRPFIPMMLRCFDLQTYPKNLVEWIIIDDGTDPIEDLVKDHPNIKYFKYDTKMSLGKKRNLCHEKSSGDILLYMDDDDYYPPTRISHGVSMLMKYPSFKIAGSGILYMHFPHLDKGKNIVKFGPYRENHATAATFVFKRELLQNSRYEDEKALAEETHFLNNWNTPLLQLKPEETIFCFSHEHNSFDKKILLKNGENQHVKFTDRMVEEFVHDDEIRDFFMNKISQELQNYEPGEPKNKPDVVEQTEQLIVERKKKVDALRPFLDFKMNNGSLVKMNRHEIVGKCADHLRRGQGNTVIQIINDLLNVIKDLQNQVDTTT